jgi:hypothetical protein
MLLTVVAGTIVATQTDLTAQPEYSRLEYSRARPQLRTSPAADEETDGRRHAGFFLRSFGGVGHLSVWGGERYSGVGASAGVACGFIVDTNLALYGQVLDTSIVLSPPTRDPEAGPSGSRSLVGGGPGLAYYWEPLNIHVSGALAISSLLAARANGGGTTSAGMGLGMSLALGKEWWVARNWGLGLAGQAHLASIAGYQERTTARSYAMLLSATYN